MNRNDLTLTLRSQNADSEESRKKPQVILKGNAPIINAVKNTKTANVVLADGARGNVTAVIIRLRNRWREREMTSQSLKRRCLSAGRLLSCVYLLSPDA